MSTSNAELFVFPVPKQAGREQPRAAVPPVLISQPVSVAAPCRSPEDFKRKKTSPITSSLFNRKRKFLFRSKKSCQAALLLRKN